MILSKIRRFRKILRKLERELNDRLKENTVCCGVSLAQCHAVLELEEQEETTIGKLAKSLGLDKSTLSRTIDGLFNVGLVKRFPHQTDRRFMAVTLTEQGQATCRKINSTSDDYFTRIFQTIPEEKHDMVIESFGIVAEAMKKGRRIENEV
jgi:DNA-binding MarR family transcriptional regulator